MVDKLGGFRIVLSRETDCQRISEGSLVSDSHTQTTHPYLNRLKVVGVEAAAVGHIRQVSHRGHGPRRRRRVPVGHGRCR